MGGGDRREEVRPTASGMKEAGVWKGGMEGLHVVGWMGLRASFC